MDNLTTITVNTGKKYPVYIANGLLSQSGKILSELIPVCKLAVITDDVVAPLYLDALEKSLSDYGFKVISYVIPNGEQSKNFDTYIKIINFLAENEITRSDAVLALGGGVVGDITGFASASFLRGIKYFQVPTTLLAATDSSVGGKTAIDIEKGKNLVGAFKQPDAVICDVDIISSLPKDIFDCGMGEVAKYAILDDKVFAELMKPNFDLQNVIALCVDYKRRIVEIDEFEKAERRLLNLGHTPAHAIEKLSGYSIFHGKAVSMGLYIMLKYSLVTKKVSKETYDKIYSMLEKTVGIIPCEYSASDMAEVSLGDKKRAGEFINVVVIHGIGDVRQEKIHVDELEKVFKC